MDDLGKSMYEYLFVIFSFRCAIMVFGEALVLAFLATAVALFCVSVHSIFTSKHNSLLELRKLEDQMIEKYGDMGCIGIPSSTRIFLYIGVLITTP